MSHVDRLRVVFAGCGFLASHLIPHVIPHASRIVLIDRERVENVNYDNAILPKAYSGKRKVSALSSMIQILSSVETIPIHLNIGSTCDLLDVFEVHDVTLQVVTFDNARSRILARDAALEAHLPTIFWGVTEDFIYIDWAEHVRLPESDRDITLVEDELRRIRDVCTRLEFRGLGVIGAGYVYHAIMEWINKDRKLMYHVSTRDAVHSTCMEVE